MVGQTTWNQKVYLTNEDPPKRVRQRKQHIQEVRLIDPIIREMFTPEYRIQHCVRSTPYFRNFVIFHCDDFAAPFHSAIIQAFLAAARYSPLFIFEYSTSYRKCRIIVARLSINLSESTCGPYFSPSTGF